MPPANRIPPNANASGNAGDGAISGNAAATAPNGDQPESLAVPSYSEGKEADTIAFLQGAIATRELAALSAVLQRFRDETEVSLTSLARLADASSGLSGEAAEALKVRIENCAKLKSDAVEALGLEFDSLRGGCDALFAGRAASGAADAESNTAADAIADINPKTSDPDPSQVLPDALCVGDLFDEGVLLFLPTKDISKGVAYTCKRWNRAARSESLRKRIVKRDFMGAVAPLRQEGVVLSNPTSPDQMTYLQFAESRFEADAIISKWLSSNMMEHPAIKKLLMQKPDEIGVKGWLVKNDKVFATRSCLVMLQGGIIPEFFQRYEQFVVDAYMAREKVRKIDKLYDPGEPVELPEVPRGLSAKATKYHRRARHAVTRIYLNKNFEMKMRPPCFTYFNDHALFLFSTGPIMSLTEIYRSMSAFDDYYENEPRI